MPNDLVQPWGYNPYKSYNRFVNLDSIETKIAEAIIKSTDKYADIFWKILKYDDLNALSQPSLNETERRALVNNDNGESKDKRLFITPRDADGQVDQCSSVYIYVETVQPIDAQKAVIGVTVDTSVYTKIGVVAGDGDVDSSEHPEWVNPNESDEQGSVVVPIKSRATVLLKSILALLNGLYIDGVGYLEFNKYEKIKLPLTVGFVDMPHNHKENSHGHRISFMVEMSGVSTTANIGK